MSFYYPPGPAPQPWQVAQSNAIPPGSPLVQTPTGQAMPGAPTPPPTPTAPQGATPPSGFPGGLGAIAGAVASPTLGRLITSPITAPVSPPKAGGGGGGAGVNAGGTDPYAPHIGTLQQMGFSPDAINSITAQARQSAIKSDAISKMPKELQDAITQYQTDQSNRTTQSLLNQSMMNPLAMQMFFSHTIAPYLNQLQSQYASLGKQAASSVNVAQLPPAYRNVMQQAAQQQGQGMLNMGTALSAAAAAGPYVDTLNKQLQAAIQAQDYDRYVRERALAYSMYGGMGGLGTTGTTPGAGVAQGMSPSQAISFNNLMSTPTNPANYAPAG